MRPFISTAYGKEDCKRPIRASWGGLCDEDRSLISPDYARNFICDFILGREQKNSQTSIQFE